MDLERSRWDRVSSTIPTAEARSRSFTDKRETQRHKDTKKDKKKRRRALSPSFICVIERLGAV